MHARSSRSTFVVGPVNQESSGALRRASTFGPEIDEKLENIWSSTYSAEYRGVEDSPSASGRSGSSFSSSSSPFTPSASGSPATLEAADPAPVPSPEDPSRLVTVTSHPVELQFQPASAQQHPSQNAVENSPSPASSPSASSTTPPITQPAGCGNPASRPVTSPGIETNGHRAPSTELPQDEPPSLATHSGHDLRVWPWSEAECPSVLANDAIALGAEAPQSLYEEFSYGVLDTSGESMATFRGSPLRVVEDVEWDQLMMNQGGDGGSLGAEFEHDFSGGLGFIYPSSSSL
ncbi:hypothetical protein ONZ51_g8903 [Trametes cubensis]|uniref:Uncharacterized protein n=1 Tax=Trametes cubensis TaxID=1111947 RepID=A0AAD7TMD2_9APHY|nr:hypothetical protein ONZ51_g8903 [Trametes cubensis]